MKNLLLGLILAATFSPLTSIADSDKTFAVGVNAGTRGVGLGAIYGLNNNLNVRANFSDYDISESFEEEGIDYDGEFKLDTIGVMLDYFPFGGSFRVTAGYFNNGTYLTAGAVASNGSVDINGFDYDISGESVDVRMDWDSGSPYIGIGWGNPLGEGSNLTFTVDIGLLMTGEPNASLSATPGLFADAALLGRDLQLDLDAEETELNGSLGDFDQYPVIQIGLTYAF